MKIAIPNKGSLSELASEMLSEAGYRTRRDQRDLFVADEANNVEIFYLRPRDIAIYVADGTVDAGITGRDLLIDAGVNATEHLPLGFGHSTFRFAARPEAITSLAELAGRRVATSYPILVSAYLEQAGIDADVIRLDGAVETAVRLGVADAVADVVETGSTLRAAGLATFGEPILESEAVLVRPDERIAEGLDVFTRRLHGVIVAHRYVLMDYDMPVAGLEEAIRITPGLESPTISPLHDADWVAVRAMVERDRTNEVMDELYVAGAKAIIVTAIHACRL